MLNPTIQSLLDSASPVPFCGCWLWMRGATGLGYPQVSVDGSVIYAHRLMLSLVLGRELEDGENALHSCDVPLCISPAHIFLGTHAENMDDKCRKGRNFIARGELSGAAKLTNAEVMEIRRRYSAGGCSHRSLAAEFGVSHRSIGDVINKKVWSHV